jgi:hypothetical protein
MDCSTSRDGLAYNKLEMATERQLPAHSLRPLSLDSIDIESDEQIDSLTKQVLDAGNAIAESERAEMIRKGIIDDRGNLLKTELPEDMRKDANRDFGG